MAFALCSAARLRRTSQINTAPAVATLKELTLPYMGMETIPSHASRTIRETPAPSLPNTSAHAPEKSVS